ncbi:MAG: hypothetical protein ACOC80_05270 [Petrotogales bacterium]
MNKILMSIMTIGIAAAMMGAGTLAAWEHSETSNNNRLGTITFNTDIAAEIWDKNVDPESDGTPKDVEGTVIFTIEDIIPGDYGYAQFEVNLTITDPDIANITINIGNAQDGGDADDHGLSEVIIVRLWASGDGDNYPDGTGDVDLCNDVLMDVDEITYTAFTDVGTGLYDIGLFWELPSDTSIDYEDDWTEFTITVTTTLA